MSRFVVPKNPGLASATAEPPDDFRGRLVKYLPADIVAFYTCAIGGIISSKPADAAKPWIALGLIVAFTLGTFVYFWKKAPHGVVRDAHMIASPIAFLALSYPLAAPLLGDLFIGWAAIIGEALAALVAFLLEPEVPLEQPKGKTAETLKA
jgi:hypothetical protein